MNLSDFIQKTKRIIYLSKKPSRREVRYGLQMNLLAIVLLGLVTFIIRILFWVIASL
ncbi:MAG: hypothetical protein OdinLCB4_002535 [Candidatus Odinarchaeum yellowstonii]|uniref:Protein translocase SEC61 complex subunit gamma n=1 Tax=Odinarchaeota yellowstonii (strain LCB_4) TaxID=1841599 RepID=A0AAF0D342_ODILC|nr:MAG: hypothetical protein OdinLCB4_002535 [Candidatus Odinarchaeum yellowstonii]